MCSAMYKQKLPDNGTMQAGGMHSGELDEYVTKIYIIEGHNARSGDVKFIDVIVSV